MSAEEVWYVAYGSNMSPERLAKYLTADTSLSKARKTRLIEQSVWSRVDREVYFAGSSKTWSGPVAFMSLVEKVGIGSPTRAFRVSPDELVLIAQGENAGLFLDWKTSFSALSYGWTPLPAFPSKPGDAFASKYNALLRLPDIDGRPALTLTTSRLLHIGIPSLEYLEVINSALSEAPFVVTPVTIPPITEGLSPSDNADFIWAAPCGPLTFSLDVRSTPSGQFPVLRLPVRAAAIVNGVTVTTAMATLGKRRSRVWVIFDLEDADPPRLSASVLRNLRGRKAVAKVPSHGESIDFTVELPIIPRRLGGLLTRLSDADVVHVNREMARELGKWALATTGRFAGPARVVGVDSVPYGVLRVAYGTRTLWSLPAGSDRRLSLQPLGQFRRRRSSPATLPSKLLEPLLGAPVVALRSSEGLVGDDGRMVVRVDQSALDFLGLESGHEVVVSWGKTRTIARVLLQGSGTTEWMKSSQLTESTGRQVRSAITDIPTRLDVPDHLRVWVSARVRRELAIPPDSVIRLRRSLLHAVLRNTASLALPVAGLVVAGIAIPSLPWYFWGVGILVVVVVTNAPLRMKNR